MRHDAVDCGSDVRRQYTPVHIEMTEVAENVGGKTPEIAISPEKTATPVAPDTSREPATTL